MILGEAPSRHHGSKTVQRAALELAWFGFHFGPEFGIQYVFIPPVLCVLPAAELCVQKGPNKRSHSAIVGSDGTHLLQTGQISNSGQNEKV